MRQDDEFLMMGATPTDALIEQYLAPSPADLVGQEPVLFGAEREAVGVRSPDQASDIHASPNQIAEQRADLGAAIAQAFVGVATPVSEVQFVAGDELRQLMEQVLEIRRAVHECAHLIALGPGVQSGATGIDTRCRVRRHAGTSHSNTRPFLHGHGAPSFPPRKCLPSM